MNTRAMNSVGIILVVLFVVTVKWAQAGRPTSIEETPVVATTAGRVKGNVLISRLGDRFYAFRGIRYAKPPIGSLRFQVRKQIQRNMK